MQDSPLFFETNCSIHVHRFPTPGLLQLTLFYLNFVSQDERTVPSKQIAWTEVEKFELSKTCLQLKKCIVVHLKKSEEKMYFLNFSSTTTMLQIFDYFLLNHFSTSNFQLKCSKLYPSNKKNSKKQQQQQDQDSLERQAEILERLNQKGFAILEKATEALSSLQRQNQTVRSINQVNDKMDYDMKLSDRVLQSFYFGGSIKNWVNYILRRDDENSKPKDSSWSLQDSIDTQNINLLPHLNLEVLLLKQKNPETILFPSFFQESTNQKIFVLEPSHVEVIASTQERTILFKLGIERDLIHLELLSYGHAKMYIRRQNQVILLCEFICVFLPFLVEYLLEKNSMLTVSKSESMKQKPISFKEINYSTLETNTVDTKTKKRAENQAKIDGLLGLVNGIQTSSQLLSNTLDNSSHDIATVTRKVEKTSSHVHKNCNTIDDIL